MQEIEKPFDVTKAVDFTDEQIAATWVDLRGGGFADLANPRSAMPIILLGSKGSGRTHLMRYYSYALQRLRASGSDLPTFIGSEGYIGIYTRCEGLNAGRFAAKGQSEEAWSTLFTYYMDLWLGQLALMTLSDAYSGVLAACERELAQDIAAVFDDASAAGVQTASGISKLLTELRREVDLAVNNAALTRSLAVLKIRTTRGRLVFEIPKIFAKHAVALKGVRIVYLIDELENLLEWQQQYVNTLVREKELPCTFFIGSRLYGFRTRRTLSASEENRAGSEYERIVLDDQLRDDPRFTGFAYDLIAQRLRSSGLFVPPGAREAKGYLDSLFEELPSSKFETEQTKFVEGQEVRAHLARLRKKIVDAIDKNGAPGVETPDQADEIVSLLAVTEFPLVEKINTFLLYQDWAARKKDLRSAALLIKQDCDALLKGGTPKRHQHALSHFKGDLLAQMRREARQQQRYCGLSTFIDMAAGIPRHLMIVLKYIHRWATFHGETPFGRPPISLEAQRVGVLQAANWFFEDASTIGAPADGVRASVDRYAHFLHELRFSDKPVESSLTMFSYDPDRASPVARRTIEDAANYSLLLHVVSGHKDNDSVAPKFQLNPMLCPRFDLPLARRGVVSLRPEEVEAIFGEEGDAFSAVLAERMAGMMAPFREPTRRKKPTRRKAGDPPPGNQGLLPGL